MAEYRNKLQPAVDDAVRAAKDRRQLVATASRGQLAPESLTVDEIKRICDFAMSHADCGKVSKIS